MRETQVFDPLKGKHAVYVADGEGEALVVIHQHIRHSALESGALNDPGRVWQEPLVEVLGKKHLTVEQATDLFAALAAGIERATEWKFLAGKAVPPDLQHSASEIQ